MTGNWTASTGVPSSSSSSNVSTSFYVQCQQSIASQVIFFLFTCFNVLVLLPLFVAVLYMGFRRWRRQRSSPAGMTMSNTDFFTYNMMVVELFGVVGSVVCSVGDTAWGEALMMWGVLLFAVPFSGQILLHLLTCVERYLAVVHPVTYRHLGDALQVRIRSIGAVVVWLLCFGWMWVSGWFYPDFPITPLFSMMGVCLSVMFFCCVSVLCVLVRPGPGQEGGTKQHVDQSKRRALQMIAAITGTLVLRSVGFLFWLGLINLQSSTAMGLCVLIDAGTWLMVPSSLVLPVLFLHRVGKLPCSRQADKSG